MVAGATPFAVDSRALANFMSDNADFSFAFSALHSAVGDRHRVLLIEVDQNRVHLCEGGRESLHAHI
jgi:hypothetical protein